MSVKLKEDDAVKIKNFLVINNKNESSYTCKIFGEILSRKKMSCLFVYILFNVINLDGINSNSTLSCCNI